MPKISALPPMVTADAADEAPIVDTSVTTTKKWTLTLLKTYLQSLTAWVTSTMLVGIDKSLLTTDSNPYKASVYRNAAQNAGNNAFAKVNFDTERFDTNNNFDSTTNFRYTAPVAGFYQFNFNVGLNIAGGATDSVASLYKNGATFRWGIEAPNASGSSGSGLIQLAASDYIEVFMYTNNGQALSVGVTPSKTNFDIMLSSRT